MFVPLAALLGFFTAFVLVFPLNWSIHYLLWNFWHPMPGKMFLMYALPYDAAMAASLVIQFGTYAAPRHKRVVAFCLLICGALVAWSMVGDFYSPEAFIPPGLHHSAPIRVWWPLIGTYLGGIVTFTWLYFASPRSPAGISP
jgi:hypothetical protein